MAMFSESVSVGTRGDRTVIVSELARECVVIQGFTLDCYGGKGSMIFLTRAAALKVAELLGRWAAQPIQDVEPVNVGQQSGESPERCTTLPVFLKL
jgi:hypothetical protein